MSISKQSEIALSTKDTAKAWIANNCGLHWKLDMHV